MKALEHEAAKVSALTMAQQHNSLRQSAKEQGRISSFESDVFASMSSLMKMAKTPILAGTDEVPIYKLKTHDMAAVVDSLDCLNGPTGPLFGDFKCITCKCSSCVSAAGRCQAEGGVERGGWQVNTKLAGTNSSLSRG